MSAQDLINWGELSRLLSGSRMNIRKNRIPQKYEADVQKLVSHIETKQPVFFNVDQFTDMGLVRGHGKTFDNKTNWVLTEKAKQILNVQL